MNKYLRFRCINIFDCPKQIRTSKDILKIPRVTYNDFNLFAE